MNTVASQNNNYMIIHCVSIMELEIVSQLNEEASKSLISSIHLPIDRSLLYISSQ